MIRVLFLTKYGRQGGSSRYMVHDYLEFYRQAGMECTVSPLLDTRYFSFQMLDQPTGLAEIVRHNSYYLARVRERFRRVLSSPRYDLVVFEKELLPYAPYGLEALLKARQPKTVALFDDAMHVYYRQHPYLPVRLLCARKIERVIRNCACVITWNDHLGQFARRFNPNVSVVNSGIDLRRYRVKTYGEAGDDPGPVVVGWIGTPNSFPYIRSLETVFQKLAEKYDIEFHVISSQDYSSPHIRVVNKRWSIETEVDALLSLDIGVMPLPDNEWTWGKSGVKAIQYLGVGVPVVCSAVGMAVQLVQDGVNGFLASSVQDWVDKLALLIESPPLRRELGLKGRQTVETTYTIQTVAPQLIQVLKDVAR